MQKFNKTHPELREGEVFLTNVDDTEDYSYISWKSKRKGYVAYSKSGEILEYMRPIFVEKSELDETGITLSE